MKRFLRIAALFLLLAVALLAFCGCSTYRPVTVEQSIPYGCGVDENGKLYKYVPEVIEVIRLWT